MTRSYPADPGDPDRPDLVHDAMVAAIRLFGRIHPLAWVAIGSAALTWFALR